MNLKAPKTSYLSQQPPLQQINRVLDPDPSILASSILEYHMPTDTPIVVSFSAKGGDIFSHYWPAAVLLPFAFCWVTCDKSSSVFVSPLLWQWSWWIWTEAKWASNNGRLPLNTNKLIDLAPRQFCPSYPNIFLRLKIILFSNGINYGRLRPPCHALYAQSNAFWLDWCAESRLYECSFGYGFTRSVF